MDPAIYIGFAGNLVTTSGLCRREGVFCSASSQRLYVAEAHQMLLPGSCVMTPLTGTFTEHGWSRVRTVAVSMKLLGGHARLLSGVTMPTIHFTIFASMLEPPLGIFHFAGSGVWLRRLGPVLKAASMRNSLEATLMTLPPGSLLIAFSTTTHVMCGILLIPLIYCWAHQHPILFSHPPLF